MQWMGAGVGAAALSRISATFAQAGADRLIVVSNGGSEDVPPSMTLINPDTLEVLRALSASASFAFLATRWASARDIIWGGVPQKIAGISLATGAEVAAVAIESRQNYTELTPDGRHLLSAARFDDKLYKIDARPDVPDAERVLEVADHYAGSNPCDMTSLADGSYAFTPDRLGETVSVFSVDPLAKVATLAMERRGEEPLEPFMATVSPRGDYLLVENARGAGSESIIDVRDPNSPREAVRFAQDDGLGTNPLTSEITPDGRFGLVICRGSSDVTVIDLDATHRLRPRPGNPVMTRAIHGAPAEALRRALEALSQLRPPSAISTRPASTVVPRLPVLPATPPRGGAGPASGRRGRGGGSRFRPASVHFHTPPREIRMNFIAPRAEPLIREIPLSRLSLAPENVRKTPPDACADASLKASIAAIGLLENLVVRPDEPDDDGAERYAVVAGGRRLKAMQDLVEDEVFDADNPVPCQVRSGDAEPAELSLAENVVRIAMHPADQVVAARFGASERIVEQRLRLGNAAPELLDAYRADEIDLEVLKAFAVTADRERQMAVWEQVSGQGYRPSAWQVKRLLTEERVPGTSAVARFVGVETYEAGGGAVMRDLFADEHEHGVWFEDPVLLEKLATEKLQAAADELATRWKWAVPMIEANWSDTASYGRIEPQPGTPTDEERAEIEKLETRYDELRGMDDDEWTEPLLEEAGRIEARLDEIEGAVEARAVFRREDFAMAGCIVTVGNNGALQVIAGLVKPEDMPKPAESGPTGPQAASGHDPDAGTHGAHTAGPSVSTPMAPPKDRDAEARKEAGVGIGLADDLRSIRTALVKAKLAGDFEAAFDLALFQMGRAVFAPGYHDHALDIAVTETPDRPNTRMNDADFADWSPGEAMLEDRSHLSLDWLAIEDGGESFAALRALPRSGKEALFAACVARTVKGQLAFEPQARPELEATVARLDIDFAKHVRPTADMLWSRIAKARVLDIARTVFGLAWASARSKYKKPALAEAMDLVLVAGVGFEPTTFRL